MTYYCYLECNKDWLTDSFVVMKGLRPGSVMYNLASHLSLDLSFSNSLILGLMTGWGNQNNASLGALSQGMYNLYCIF